MAKKKGRGLLAFAFILLPIVLIILFIDNGLLKLFFADIISPTWQDDLKVLIQTGGLLILMIGAPVIIVLLICVVGKYGTAMADAVLDDDDEKEELRLEEGL